MIFRPRLSHSTLAMAALLSVTSIFAAEPFVLVAAPSGMIYAPLVERLLSNAGFTMELTEQPAERALLMTQKGEVDGEFFRQPSAIESIRDQVLLIGPLACVELVAFVRTDSGIQIKSPRELDNFRVAAPLGNKLAEQVSVQYQPARHVVRETKLLMDMLMAERIDVAIESERIGLKVINDLGLQGQIQRTGPLLTSVPTYLVLRRNLNSWGGRLQKAFAEMKSSGQWQKMFADISAANGFPRAVSQSCLNNFIPPTSSLPTTLH
jgi:ABC-type amino acid transport substrate-binding protein